MSGADQRALASATRPSPLVLGLLASSAAWFGLIAVSASWASPLQHGALAHAGSPAWGAVALAAGWALMLVMFAAGVGSLLLTAGLTVVMVAEKTHELGRRLSTPVAIALLAGAVAAALAA